jgi:hypothetical protein
MFQTKNIVPLLEEYKKIQNKLRRWVFLMQNAYHSKTGHSRVPGEHLIKKEHTIKRCLFLASISIQVYVCEPSTRGKHLSGAPL